MPLRGGPKAGEVAELLGALLAQGQMRAPIHVMVAWPLAPAQAPPAEPSLAAAASAKYSPFPLQASPTSGGGVTRQTAEEGVGQVT